MKFKILDCTLRDGGFHTKWDFNNELVDSYINSVNQLKIDELEIGFRFTEKEGWLGKFAYTTEETLEEFELRSDLNVGVMIFSGEFVDNGELDKELLKKIFPFKKDKSRIDFVRIATYLPELEFAILIAKFLNNLGYHASLHLMKIHNTTELEFTNIAKKAEVNKIDRVYFADSLGSMFPNDIQRVVASIKKEYSGPIGLHAHNNLGLAFINSVAAIDCGATWVDGTLTGIGRGPGNTKLEELLFHYFENDDKYNDNLIKLLEDHFYPIQNKYGWGSNPFYFLAGKYNIHPSYLQDMIENDKFDRKDILSFLMNYQNLDKESYNPEIEDTGYIHYSKLVNGNFDVNKLTDKKEVLIIGSGDTVKNNKNDIELFIRKFKPLVFQLNKGEIIDENLIDYNLYCHPQTIKYENNNIKNPKNNTIIPPNSIDYDVKNKKVKFYGLQVEKEKFSTNSTNCVTPNSLVLSYALAIASASENTNIYLAGIDGYLNNQNKNNEISTTLELYKNHYDEKKLTSITPTIFSISQVSPHKLLRDISK
tara:strand:+ start:63 stop:1670 length:1608 start_codon:yes stop_codon:yes gene_type:complete